MMEWRDVGLVVAAYLLGSISWSYVIVRVLKGQDIRTLGSGNAGATNVLRIAGPIAGLVAFSLDVGKGAIAVMVARAFGAPYPVLAMVAVAAILGHIFPVFFGFRGGKGVATAAGTLGSLVPGALLVALLVFALVVGLFRFVSLASLCAALAFPITVFFFQGALVEEARIPYMIAAAAAALLVVFKHRTNIARLLSGTESKLGKKKVQGAAP